MSERKLKAWEAAGLLDVASAARIRAWEAEHARPLGLWAVIGIAALAIGLGLISVVAANWDAIPGEVRLAIHFALLAGIAAFIGAKGGALTGRRPWLHEAILFVFAMLGMTFLGHVGQVYQTTSPLWQPLALWLLIFAPLLLVEGLSWLCASLVMGTLVFAIWNHVINTDQGAPDTVNTLRWALEIGAPATVAALAAGLRSRSRRIEFWRRMEQLAFAYVVCGASLIVTVSAFDHWTTGSDSPYMLLGLAMLAAIAGVTAAWIWKVLPGASGQAMAGIMAGCGLVGLVAYPLSGSHAASGLLFMALWAGIAAAALHGGWRGVFQGAVAVLALRLIVLSFELAGDLLTSGAGLIASGLLILGVAWLAMRVSKRFAPDKEAGT